MGEIESSLDHCHHEYFVGIVCNYGICSFQLVFEDPRGLGSSVYKGITYSTQYVYRVVADKTKEGFPNIVPKLDNSPL